MVDLLHAPLLLMMTLVRDVKVVEGGIALECLLTFSDVYALEGVEAETLMGDDCSLETSRNFLPLLLLHHPHASQ